MIDSHCHLDFHHFDTDRPELLNRCAELGLTDIVIPGVRASQWPSLQALCTRHWPVRLHYALGLHPYFLNDYRPEHLLQLTQCLQNKNHRAVAMGEMGIDQAIDIPLKIQQQVFEQQLQLATEVQLPVIVHHRKSHHLLMQGFKACQFRQGGVIHGFSGSEQQAWQYIEAGFALGVGGVISYTRARVTRQTIQTVPLEHLVLETDAPDMPLAGFQGQRNSPEKLPLIAAEVARLKQIAVDDVVRQTRINSQQLFGLSTD